MKITNLSVERSSYSSPEVNILGLSQEVCIASSPWGDAANSSDDFDIDSIYYNEFE